MALPEDVKLALRVSGSVFDVEISGLIKAARNDLMAAGIIASDTDPLFHQAIILYCKTHFGWDNQEADRFERSYESIKRQLATMTKYIGGDEP
jgi:hypothetical protein